jgi:hypothetical protein
LIYKTEPGLSLSGFSIAHNGKKVLCQHGHLKNFSRALALLLIKDNKMKTFSKAHTAKNYCQVQQHDQIL